MIQASERVSEKNDGNITKIIFHLNLIAVKVAAPKRNSRDFNTPWNACVAWVGKIDLKSFFFLHEKQNKST